MLALSGVIFLSQVASLLILLVGECEDTIDNRQGISSQNQSSQCEDTLEFSKKMGPAAHMAGFSTKFHNFNLRSGF